MFREECRSKSFLQTMIDMVLSYEGIFKSIQTKPIQKGISVRENTETQYSTRAHFKPLLQTIPFWPKSFLLTENYIIPRGGVHLSLVMKTFLISMETARICPKSIYEHGLVHAAIIFWESFSVPIGTCL